MSKLSKEEVLKLARLSRLRLSDDEVTKFQAELNEILTYVESLSAVDVSGLQPTYQVTGLTNSFRPDDIIEYQATPDDLLRGVPKRQGRYIQVGKML